MKLIIFGLSIVLVAVAAYEISDIASGRIETCRGCSLNRLPEVKKFVMNDAPEYNLMDVKFITGAPPELVLLDEKDHELERLPLSQLSREECNNLLKSKGFTPKNKNSDL